MNLVIDGMNLIMNVGVILFAGPLFAASILSLILMVFVLKKNKSQNLFWFSILLASITLWSLFYAFEIVFLDQGLTLFFAKLKYVGIAITPASWFLFSVLHTQRKKSIPKKIIGLILAIPILSIIMLFSNSLHHLFWNEILFIGNNQISIVSATADIFFWIHTIYSYGLIFIGTVLFLTNMFGKKDIFSKQNLVLLFGVSIPFIGNIIIVFDFIRFPFGFDITPLLFMVTAISFFFSIFYYKFLELIPAARDEIFDHFTQAIFVLNKNMIIVDQNDAAEALLRQSYLSTTEKQVKGCLINSLFDQIFPHGVVNEVGINSSIVQMHSDTVDKWFEISMNPLMDKRNKVEGHLLTLNDVTDQILAERKLREKIDELEQFKKVTIDRELKMVELKKKINQYQSKMEMN